MQLPRFDPFHPEMRRDPFAVYRRYAEASPVHWGKPSNPGLQGAWYAFDHDSARRILKDRAFGREVHRNVPNRARPPYLRPLLDHVDRWVMFRDPPYHSHLRAPLAGFFSSQSAAAYALAREALVHAHLERLGRRESFDVVTELAVPLARASLAMLSGIRESELTALASWTTHMARVLDLKRDRASYAVSGAIAEDLGHRLRRRLIAPASGDGPSLRARLVELVRAGELSLEEAVSTLMLVLVTGQETTRNVIANGVLALLQNPGELASLRERPALAESCVEEILRFAPPVHLAGRIARDEVTLGGVRILPGDPVVACLAAANRDPRLASAPEAFVISRPRTRHVAFGSGIHLCLGLWFARGMAADLFRAMAPLLADLQVAGPPVWRPLVLFRSLASLPVERRGAARASSARRGA